MRFYLAVSDFLLIFVLSLIINLKTQTNYESIYNITKKIFT